MDREVVVRRKHGFGDNICGRADKEGRVDLDSKYVGRFWMQAEGAKSLMICYIVDGIGTQCKSWQIASNARYWPTESQAIHVLLFQCT